MQYSPKLKKAMMEIKQVLMKYDIAGTAVIHTMGHAEYLNHITPSYSCAKIDERTGRFELKAKRVHFSNDAERQNKLTATSNMLKLLSEISGRNVLSLMQASEATDNFLNAEHGDEGHTSHSTQNNQMLINLSDFYFQTDIGLFCVERISHLDQPVSVLQRDSFLIESIFKESLKTFMKHIILDEKTQLPKIVKLEYRQTLSESNQTDEQYNERLMKK